MPRFPSTLSHLPRRCPPGQGSLKLLEAANGVQNGMPARAYRPWNDNAIAPVRPRPAPDP